MPTRARYVPIPIPEPGGDGGAGVGPFLEGGDVLVYGKDAFVGESAMAGDHTGTRWPTAYLAPDGYTVTPVPLKPHVLRLDCALGLVREGVMIVCPDRLPEGVPTPLREWERLEVSCSTQPLARFD